MSIRKHAMKMAYRAAKNRESVDVLFFWLRIMIDPRAALLVEREPVGPAYPSSSSEAVEA